MKISFVLFTVVIGYTATAVTVLSKSREAKNLEAPRKLSLFIRAKDTSKLACGGSFPCNDQAKQSPLFGGVAGPVPVASSGLYTYGAAAADTGDCHPKCHWSCGDSACDEVCDPVCAPPQCETACAGINLAACRQTCDPPKCAIVCPTQHCAHGGCPACKTVCAPPKCHTECTENCESKCSDPQCTWKCNPGKCEKPRCTLTCGGAKACGLDGNLNSRPPPFTDGMTVLAKGLAATDPKSLAAAAAKPAGGSSPPSPPAAAAPAPAAPAIR